MGFHMTSPVSTMSAPKMTTNQKKSFWPALYLYGRQFVGLPEVPSALHDPLGVVGLEGAVLFPHQVGRDERECERHAREDVHPFQRIEAAQEGRYEVP